MLHCGILLFQNSSSIPESVELISLELLDEESQFSETI
jgi:hypothetical protein